MKICIQPAFAAYLAVVAVCASLAESIGAVIALVVHEAGHVMVSSWFGMRIKRIEFTPFGGVIEYGMGRGPDKGLSGALTAMAGPLCNYLTLLLLGCVGTLFPDSAVLRAAAKSSLMMMCMNLLPVLPLDGGRLVFSIGYYLWPVLPLIRLLTGLGTVLGGFCIAAAVYGAWRYVNLNLSLLVVGGYVIYCAGQCRQTMMAENIYAIVQEQKENAKGIRRLRAFSVGKDIALREILPLLDRAREAIFLCETPNGRSVVSERQICQELLRNPSGRFSDVIMKYASHDFELSGK